MKNNGIFVQNNYIDDMLINPYKHSFEEIFNYALNYDIYQKPFFDYLLVECCTDGLAKAFKQNLSNCNCYIEYINSVINGSDNVLKAYVILFLEYNLIDEIYSNRDDIINDIFNNDYEIEYKITMALQYSTYEMDKNTVMKLKKILKKNIINDDFMKSEYSNDELDNFIDEYYDIIDENQSNNTKVMHYKYKKNR